MSVNTNKNILITPGLGKSTQNSISQIDLKWYESGLGTFVFVPNSQDIRSTIYNWQDNAEPVLLFGGAGTYKGIRYFVGPYIDYTDTFAGVSSSPTVKIYPISGQIFAQSLIVTSLNVSNIIVSGFVTSGGFYGPGTNLTNLNASNLSTGTVSSAQIAGSYSGITSVGTLSQLNVSGFVTSGGFYGFGTSITNLNASNLSSGTVPSSVISGSYSGITSVGTLSQLNVSGFVTSGGFYGPGTNLTNLNASNLSSGTVPNSVISGTYSGITSVGTLSQLNVSGFVTSGGFFGFGTNITYLNASNLIAGTVPSSVVSGTYSGITSVGTLSQLNVSGFVTSGGFFGFGTNITNLNASNLSSGTVPNSVISGTYSGITSVGTLSQLNVSGFVTSGGFFGFGTNITYLNASNLIAGTVPSSVVSGTYSGITSVGTLSQLNVSGFVTSGGFFGFGTNIFNLNASNLSIGTVPNFALSGSYSGITSVGTLSQLRVIGISTLGITSFSSAIYDNNNSKGVAGQILSATANGVAWTSLSQITGGLSGSILTNQVAYGLSSSTIQGSNNLWFNGSNLGIGTSSPSQALTVQGNVSISGIITSSGYYGFGTNITGLNASNVTSGTIPNQVLSGTYSGITSFGALSQLRVLGLSTFAGNISAASISSISNIDFNINTQGLTTSPGRMFWDVNQQELAISLLYNGEIAHLGQDQVQQIYNNTGSILGVGTVVYYNGVYSGWPTVSLADAVLFNHGVGIGVIQAPIGINSYGYIHISGPVIMDTSGFSTGPLYLSATPGILTSIQPSSPNFSVNVAYAINSQTQGQIVVWPGSPLRVNQTGSILFADAQGKPGSSFTSFFIDVSGGTYNVGIGTNVAPNRLSVQGSANFNGSVTISTSLTLNAAQGIAPLIINSNTQVNNLNAQYWSGNVNPATQVGDMFYASGVAGSTISRIPPNVTTGLQFLGQAGDGVTAGAPSWQVLPTTGFLNYFLVGSAATGVPGVYQLTSNSVIGLGTITTVFNSAGTVGLGSFITQSGVPNLLYLPAGNLISYVWLYQTTKQAARFASVNATFYETNGLGTAIGVIGTTISATITATPTLYTLTYSQSSIYNFQSSSSRIKINFDATTTGNTNTIKLEYGDPHVSYVNISAPGADVTNFVPYSGAIKDLNLGNFGITANNFDVNTSPIGLSTTPGRISWNAEAGKPQIGLVYNNETANLAGNVTLVYNNSGSVIGLGTVVYISGTAGVNTAVPTIGLADNINYSHALGVGVVSKQIGISSYGYIHVAGTTSVDTTKFSPGDILYVSSSAGILTNISPYSPNFNVVVGVALNSNTNGSILVQPSSPTRLNAQGAVLWSDSQGFPIGVASYFFIDVTGGTYGVGIGTTLPAARLDINVAAFPNNKAIVLRGALNQTANIFEVRDAIGNIYNSITGIGSVGIGTFIPTQGLHVQNNARITGGIYDSNNSIGLAGSILISTGSGINWSTLSGNYPGITSVGTLTQLNVSGFVTSTGYFGPGTNITNLNATNITTGTVPSSVVSGSYSGITSIGTLTQLNVSGITTLQNTIYLGFSSFASFIYDTSNSKGTSGQVLSSTATGVAWTSISGSGSGTIGGNISANQIAYGVANSQITGISTFVYVNGNVGIGTTNPQNTIHTVGTSRLDGTLILNSNSADLRNQRIFIGANTTTTSTSFIGIASILVPLGYQLSIEGRANGWFSTTLNESGKFFGVYYNSVGVTSQVGTTDINSKFTGASGNFDIQAQSNYVTVVVKSNNASNSWYWRVGLDYLLTQNS